MPHVHVIFHEAHITKHVYGTDQAKTDELEAEVSYDLEVDGQPAGAYTGRVTQTAGATYDANLLQVEPPVLYHGPMDYQKLRDATAEYLQQCAGPNARVVRLTSNNTLVDVRVQINMGAHFDAAGRPGGGS